MDVDDSRLSQLITQWTLVLDACRGPAHAVRSAQAEVLKRYYGVIYRYSFKVLGDADLAEEACQEFAMRFVRGDFRHADPDRGRFRDYVKTAMIHLLGEIRRKQQTRVREIALHAGLAEAAVTPPPSDVEETEFLQVWRKELLNRAWNEFEQQQRESGPPYYDVLRIKADQPDLTAADLVAQLHNSGKGAYTTAAVRQVLHRARDLFADRLLDEVGRSVMSEDGDVLIQELIDLDLLTYCREALKKRGG